MDDLISRQAAIRWVKTECNPYGNPTLDFESGKKVIEHLEQMPSADVAEVRHGRWEPYLNEGLIVKCSVCGSRYAEPWHYCPNCGAKMDEVSE